MANQKIYVVVKKDGSHEILSDSWKEVQKIPRKKVQSFDSMQAAQAWIAAGFPAKKKSAPAAEATAAPADDAATTVDLSKGVVIYTDGSYGKDGATNYGWGMAIYRDGKLFAKAGGPGIHPEFQSQHNIAGELIAAVCAVKWAMSHGVKEFTLCYDLVGVGKWAQGQWEAKTVLTRAYSKFMQSHAADVAITYNWVKAHNGTEGNELADQLAKRGAVMPVPTL